MRTLGFDLAGGENARFQELAVWHRDSFLSAVFPTQGRRNKKGGEKSSKGRKNAEMEKGLKMGISCACLWQKGNKHSQINNRLIWKAFILWDAPLNFFFFFFLNSAWPTLSLQHSEEATQILHEDLTLIMAGSNGLGMKGLFFSNRNYR